MTFDFRIKLNGKNVHGQGYMHLQNALAVAQAIPLKPGDLLQVVDDGPNGEVVKLELKGETHAENE